MIPKVAAKGASFKGAGQYYLHDKDALTSDRVAFTHTENLPTIDAEKAIKCMAWTAMHQNEIKQRAGGSAKGRKLTKPVYSYSLAWHPDQEPTKDQMIAAAQETLEVLGLSDHEAIFVSHNDEPHPHIHVIVNRVHPEKGIAAKLSKDHLALSRWAEDYERKHGQILCEQRVENNRRRDRGEFAKDTQSQFYDWRRRRTQRSIERQLQARSDLSEFQKQSRLELFRMKECLIAQEREAVKRDNRQNWHALYKNQEQERARFEREEQQRRDELHAALKAKDGSHFDKPDAERKGKLSRYHKDVVSRTVPDDPKKVAQEKVGQRRSDQKRHRDDLDALLSDKDALNRDDAARTGRLSAVHGDHSNRSKSDIARDQKTAAEEEREAQLAERKNADAALRRFVTELRHVELTIGGADLLELGLPESPLVGEVLDELLALKLDGEVTTRAEEIAAAERLIQTRQTA